MKVATTTSNKSNSMRFEELIQCCHCKQLPVDAVESQCCGALYCWNCVLNVDQCVCEKLMNLEQCRPAQAVKNLLYRLSNSPSISTSLGQEGGIEDKPGASTLRSPSARGPAAPAHQKYACPDGCLVYLTVDEMKDHLQFSCPNVRVLCPNEKCSQQIPRQDLEQHVKDCPYATVPCSYGCGDVLVSEIEKHRQENMQEHLDKLQAKIEAQRVELENVKKGSAMLGWVSNCDGSVSPPSFLKYLLLFTIGLFLPCVLQVPLFVVCFWNLYLSYVRPCFLKIRETLIQKKGCSACLVKLLSAFAHLWLIWCCWYLLKAVSHFNMY